MQELSRELHSQAIRCMKVGDILGDTAKQCHNENIVIDIRFFKINSIKYCNKKLIPYCDLNFEKLVSENLIDKIVIGPECGFSEKIFTIIC